jgi:hypothetical protein
MGIASTLQMCAVQVEFSQFHVRIEYDLGVYRSAIENSVDISRNCDYVTFSSLFRVS